MSESNKWKSKLLSSSVPMEYEVAQLLVSRDFATDVDFSYTRTDGGVEKDFSVDIRATSYIPDGSGGFSSTIELLVECKYRNPMNKWLFFEDPNAGDMSPFTIGNTLRAVDVFSWLFFPDNATVTFDRDACFCVKGIEVDGGNGNVYDAEIRHGLQQLQYALPRFLTEKIDFEISSSKEDNHPFLFCPILLTTSPILVARSGVKIRDVEKAGRLEDFSSPAPWVVVHSDLTPDFDRHRKNQCAALFVLAREPWLADFDRYKYARGEYHHRLPGDQLCLLSGEKRGCPLEYFSQTVVCSLYHFPALLAKINRVARSAARRLKDQTKRAKGDGGN